MALIGILIASKPWQSEVYNECVAAGEDEGLRGADFDSWVDFCVKNWEEYGIPPR
jgi:hypothetical protein